MSRTLLTRFAPCAAALAAALLSGCGTLQRALYTPQPQQLAPAQTNFVVVNITNSVPGTTITNTLPSGDSVVLTTTNFLVSLSTNYVVTPAVWATNLVARPEVSAAIQAVELAPIPGAGILSGVLGLAVGGFASWHNRRNQAKAQAVAGTLVDNFESLRKVALAVPGYTPAIDAKVMAVVKDAQAGAGVKTIIHDLVEARTDTTRPAA